MDCNGANSLTLSPQALPGKCAQCGRANDPKGFIDTGLQFEFYGACLFCSTCVLDMASKYGFILPEVAEQLKARIVELEQETITLREAVLGLESAVDGLQSARSSIDSLSIPSVSSDTSPDTSTKEEVTEVELPSNVVEESKPDAPAGESEADESSVKPEPVGVSSNSGYATIDGLDF